MVSELEWLQRWYRSRCDGTWEHSRGVKIDTLDNPGWFVSVDVDDSATERTTRVHRAEEDWIDCKIENEKFTGSGGPDNLVEILQTLRCWLDE